MIDQKDKNMVYLWIGFSEYDKFYGTYKNIMYDSTVANLNYLENKDNAIQFDISNNNYYQISQSIIDRYSIAVGTNHLSNPYRLMSYEDVYKEFLTDNMDHMYEFSLITNKMSRTVYLGQKFQFFFSLKPDSRYKVINNRDAVVNGSMFMDRMFFIIRNYCIEDDPVHAMDVTIVDKLPDTKDAKQYRIYVLSGNGDKYIYNGSNWEAIEVHDSHNNTTAIQPITVGSSNTSDNYTVNIDKSDFGSTKGSIAKNTYNQLTAADMYPPTPEYTRCFGKTDLDDFGLFTRL